MKHWNRKLPVKVICFILCVISLLTVAASVAGAAVFAELDFYMYPEQQMLKEVIYDKIYNDAYGIMYSVLGSGEYYYEPFPNDYSAVNTNLRYRVFSPDGEIIETNTEKTNVKWDYSIPYRSVEGGKPVPVEEGHVIREDEEIYCIKLYLEEGLPVNDEYALLHRFIGVAYDLLYWIYPIGIFALILTIVCFIMLMCASARRPGSDELHPGVLHRVPIDLMLVFLFFMFAFALELIVYVWYTGELIMNILVGVWVLCALNVVLGLFMSIAARIKQRTLLTNTVIWRVCKLIWFIFKRAIGKILNIGKNLIVLFCGIPMIWRTLFMVICGIFLDYVILLLTFEWEWGAAILLCVLKDLVFLLAALYSSWFMRKLQKGGEAIAKGDLSYRIDTHLMFRDLKRHGENLNRISDGMSAAVDERLRSERMKTELITNVSHDIKTPLTSIINYATLINDEECSSENHREYSEVLMRKSEHLKRLLDDLVEVSKANTGNLDVELVPCEAGVLLTQVAGEFEERCRAVGLELITVQPEKSVRIMADSRRIWRVFENLMSNACKYSLSGSRVYLSLEYTGNEAVFVFRNTSAIALNISPDELMERFVRGDASRTTEGSGLGLSIARSLTELQNGSMDITIDGDLFKVILRFPII